MRTPYNRTYLALNFVLIFEKSVFSCVELGPDKKNALKPTNAYSVSVLHHQLVREVGAASGILKPIAGKQLCGAAPLSTDPLALASVWLVLSFSPHLFIVRAHCTCSTTRDPSSTVIAVRVKIIIAVENRITIGHLYECFYISQAMFLARPSLRQPQAMTVGGEIVEIFEKRSHSVP